MSNPERFQIYTKNPERLPAIAEPQEAMELLLLAKNQEDTFVFDYALDARRLETWARSRLADLPNPQTVQFSDSPDEYTSVLLGATSRTIQQWDTKMRDEFDRLLYLSRIVYRRPDEAL